MKKGFGIIEVLIAAVVLGFLVVGLNGLQKGNRETILRVRARDAANFVAQHVLDSLGSVGLNSLVAGEGNIVYAEPNYIYSFEGKNIGKVELSYSVEVELLNGGMQTKDSTNFTKAMNNEYLENDYTRSLEATVSWAFKDNESKNMSITMAKVVR